MRIDRQRFLLLTASLAGGACSPAAAPVPPQPVEHTAVAPAEPSEPPVAEPQPVASDTSAAPAEPVAVASGPSSEGPAPSPTAEGRQSFDLSTDPKCNDNTGKVGKCQFKAPGPQCESFSDLASECQMLGKHLKPKVAARAVDCIASKSGTRAVCEFALASRCATESLRSGVCPDKAADKACAPIVQKCASRNDPISLDECRAGYSAVRPASQKKMLSCMSEFCTTDNCLYQL